MSKFFFIQTIFISSTLLLQTCSSLTLQGATCGSKRCSLLESCSQYSALCEPCDKICNLDSHNHEEQRCERDCQAYLLDQRYMTKTNGNDGDIREEVTRLHEQLKATLIVCALLAILIATICLYRLIRCLNDRGLFDRQWFRDRLKLKKKAQYPESPTVMRNPHAEMETSRGAPQKMTPSQSSTGGDQGSGQLSTLSASGLKLQMPSVGYQNEAPPPAPSTIASGWSTPGTETSQLATPSIAPGSNYNHRHPAEDSVYQQARVGYDNKGLNLTPSPDKREAHGF